MSREAHASESSYGLAPDDSEIDGQGQPSQTRKLIIGLQEQIGALTDAVRALEQRVPSRVVSVEEAARHLSVSVQTIRRWCKSGSLPYLRRGRELRIDLSKVRALDRTGVRGLVG